MKRVWIHTLGYILTVVGAFWNRTSTAADGVYNGALYTEWGKPTTIMAMPVIITLGPIII